MFKINLGLQFTIRLRWPLCHVPNTFVSRQITNDQVKKTLSGTALE